MEPCIPSPGKGLLTNAAVHRRVLRNYKSIWVQSRSTNKKNCWFQLLYLVLQHPDALHNTQIKSKSARLYWKIKHKAFLSPKSHLSLQNRLQVQLECYTQLLCGGPSIIQSFNFRACLSFCLCILKEITGSTTWDQNAENRLQFCFSSPSFVSPLISRHCQAGFQPPNPLWELSLRIRQSWR